MPQIFDTVPSEMIQSYLIRKSHQCWKSLKRRGKSISPIHFARMTRCVAWIGIRQAFQISTSSRAGTSSVGTLTRDQSDPASTAKVRDLASSCSAFDSAALIKSDFAFTF